VQLVDARELFVKMRKSLGEKRKQVSDEQIAEIVRLYGDFTEGDKVKIFPNEAFGFMRITVERPLRVRWEVTDDTLAALAADSKIAKLDDDVRAALATAVEGWRGESMGDAAMASKRVKDLMKSLALKGKPLETAILDALAVRDLEAEPVTDAKGNVQPDPELRDNENVPLPSVRVTYEADVEPRLAATDYRTAIADYMEAEVHPYVPDAWVDFDKTKIGYEIPLTRHFYVYTPPRPLAEIDAEIKQLEAEIQELLAEVTE
jgi:type I restriction enzyme M protein